VIDAFRTGALPILVNCEIATEGFDVPSVSCILMLRPTQSWSWYEQAVGRGTRRTATKDHVLVIDVVDKARRPQVTAPALFGLPPSFNAERQSLLWCARRWQELREFDPGNAAPKSLHELEEALAGRTVRR